MAEPFEVTDEDELRQAAEIRRRIDQAPLLLDRYEQLPTVPALGSDMAGDDMATAWMTSSHLVNATLLMAADNMRALCGLLLPTDRLSMPLFAHYPLLRSILEASALVKWLLESDDRNGRITRMLRTRWSDTIHSRDLKKEEVETVKAMGEYDVEELDRAEKAISERYARDVAKIREIAGAFSISHSVVKKGQAPWVHMVRAVCAVAAGPDWIAVPGEYAASTWRSLSGLSHPSYGGPVNNSSMERIGDGSSKGTLLARFSADLGLTQRAVDVAWNTLHEAIDLVEQRYATAR
ncbi:hypothetical protein [Microbacterium sp. nov. GSS16]|uniref:hypothetical protein n=1 Tax=Microbacterium sp. nov. GSS16 TaxID=3019890 RepID=UPI0023050580|nr:hypothetical protein [Microbacterium sp. nov. GSS16]WCD91521.1 hypothetical protein PGB26_07345 [Microbacterium sp. nov. GSS16]